MRNIFYITLYIVILSTSIYTQNLHNKFNINSDDLAKVIINEDEITKKAITTTPVNFLTLVDKLLNNSVDLTLVDKNHRLLENYIPPKMVNLSDFDLHTRYKTMLFAQYAIDDFIQMSNDAKKNNIDIFIASTYRSYGFQNRIFNNMKNFHGEEKAATIVAYPGASQHQLGTAVDFGTITTAYAYTDAGKWLKENSWKYGFTLSYPKGKESLTTYIWEPWHYRYIGPAGALIQRNYFNDIQQNFLIFWDKYSAFFLERHIH
ncbi:D-alanyl-D-alanine carboxypeptidase family protein [Thiospirochaeta perfilievii]|uniref:D-alanyl-D-alanine carboxypeptidase family protein n=1 Tax=Thiospirochaeta perfilievii TaxID=252967 RepID=A0A5C1QC36_9SPIO|nr:M15 family metallopeptidase [Thiospirochaeta perfilievii]QEN03782.1 D-alanyl-D-alanine carboxypeptidase family protein [Thiospirochaeta perfilievii]